VYAGGAQTAAIYEQCRAELGRLWHGETDTYGRLALAASPADINATTDDDAFMTYGVKSMCDTFGWIGTTSQVLGGAYSFLKIFAQC